MVAHELHTTRTGSRALSHSTARSLDPDRGRVEAKWSLNPDPLSASDADPGSRVESPTEIIPAQFCRGNVFLRGQLQKDAENYNFEAALNTKSGSISYMVGYAMCSRLFL